MSQMPIHPMSRDAVLVVAWLGAASWLFGCGDGTAVGSADGGVDSDGSAGSDAAVGLLWSDEFEGTTGTIQAHDPTWVQIFGQLDVAASDGAMRADKGTEDGGDDYGYKPQAATEVTIVADVSWAPEDAVGMLLVCAPGAANESLYELAIYRDRLQLFRYDGGGDPGVYQTLGQTPVLGLSSIVYRVVMSATLTADGWRISGELQDPASSLPVGTLEAIQDATHGPAIGQGIGIYNRSGEASRVYSIRVTGR